MSKYQHLSEKENYTLSGLHISVKEKNGRWFVKLYDGEFYYEGEGSTENSAVKNALDDYYSDMEDDHE